MAYFSSKLPSKKLKLPRKFGTIEPLVIQSTFGRHDAIVMGLYRTPKALGVDYYVRLENELNDIITWASLQKQLVTTGLKLIVESVRYFAMWRMCMDLLV